MLSGSYSPILHLIFDSKGVKKLLNLPAGAEINMIVAVGKGTEEGVYNERLRVPFEEVVFVR